MMVENSITIITIIIKTKSTTAEVAAAGVAAAGVAAAGVAAVGVVLTARQAPIQTDIIRV